MRIEIERDAPRKAWLIYGIWDTSPPRRWNPLAPELEFEEIEPGAHIEPSLVLWDEVWGPLSAAILGLPTDQAPLADHLNDARKVRDRLLTLVEGAFPAPREDH